MKMRMQLSHYKVGKVVCCLLVIGLTFCTLPNTPAQDVPPDYKDKLNEADNFLTLKIQGAIGAVAAGHRGGTNEFGAWYLKYSKRRSSGGDTATQILKTIVTTVTDSALKAIFAEAGPFATVCIELAKQAAGDIVSSMSDPPEDPNLFIQELTTQEDKFQEAYLTAVDRFKGMDEYKSVRALQADYMFQGGDPGTLGDKARRALLDLGVPNGFDEKGKNHIIANAKERVLRAQIFGALKPRGITTEDRTVWKLARIYAAVELYPNVGKLSIILKGQEIYAKDRACKAYKYFQEMTMEYFVDRYAAVDDLAEALDHKCPD